LNFPPGPTLRRPLGTILRHVGPLGCLVGGLRVVAPEPPCSFGLVGGDGEWIDADTGAWTPVTDATFEIVVQSHRHIGGIFRQARAWERDGTPLVYACGDIALLHDGTLGMLLPRTRWTPPPP
jgi:hypothetical protein